MAGDTSGFGRFCVNDLPRQRKCGRPRKARSLDLKGVLPDSGGSGMMPASLPVKPTEIFRDITPETGAKILRHLKDNDKAALQGLREPAGRPPQAASSGHRAPHGRRAVRVDPLELTRGSNEDAAVEVVQAWLLGAHQDMIIRFLDFLQVPHDGRGLLETLPAEPPKEALQGAIDELFANHDAAAVAIYLNVFIEMDIAQWPILKQLTQEDPPAVLAPQATNA